MKLVDWIGLPRFLVSKVKICCYVFYSFIHDFCFHLPILASKNLIIMNYPRYIWLLFLGIFFFCINPVLLYIIDLNVIHFHKSTVWWLDSLCFRNGLPKHLVKHIILSSFIWSFSKVLINNCQTSCFFHPVQCLHFQVNKICHFYQ